MKKNIVLSGKDLVYTDQGAGRPVILIHGFGEKGNVWVNQVRFLETNYRVLVPNLPGSGESAIQDDMSVDGLADAVKAIIDQEKLDNFVILGHSMGGYITLALAEKFPDLMPSFGLIHSSAFADSEEKKATRRKGIEFIRKNGAVAFLKNSTPKLFSPITADERPELIDGFLDDLSNFSADALVLYYEAMIARPDRTAELKKPGRTVLFVFGKADTAIPLEDGLKLCHLPEKSYIEILSRSGHMGMLEEPETMNKAIGQFLTEV